MDLSRRKTVIIEFIVEPACMAQLVLLPAHTSVYKHSTNHANARPPSQTSVISPIVSAFCPVVHTYPANAEMQVPMNLIKVSHAPRVGEREGKDVC